MGKSFFFSFKGRLDIAVYAHETTTLMVLVTRVCKKGFSPAAVRAAVEPVCVGLSALGVHVS
jgi:hypothetical protein